MNKTIVLREGSKVEDFSMENLLGAAASGCFIDICIVDKDCDTKTMKPVCPSDRRLALTSENFINLSF